VANARTVTTVTIPTYVNSVDQVPTRKDSVQHLLKNQEQVNKNYPQSTQHSRLHIHQKFSHEKINSPVVTPIKVDKLAKWIQGYNTLDTEYLLNGFLFGFKIPYKGNRSYRFHKHLLSATSNMDTLKEKIAKEILAGRVAGPFESPPFQNLQISPLGLVPKKTPGEMRVIHHLSYPEGTSINDGIPEKCSTVNYQTIDDAVSLILYYGPGSLMSKTDIEHSFKLIPIHPDDHELLGFSLDNKFYYDKTLPMGLSFSCNLFEKFSSSIHWVVDHKLKSTGCVHVLDDFLFVGPPNSYLCLQTLQQFLSMADDIGIPIKNEKTVLPTTVITFLGLELDTVAMELRLPEDKLIKLREKLIYFKTRKKVTLRELQLLIGLLNFACTVVKPGRAFLRRLIDLTLGLKHPNHRRWLTKESRADLNSWSVFVDNFNGKSLLSLMTWENSEQLGLFTDASNLGFGATFGSKWFSDQWVPDMLSYHITLRELFPIVLALEIWGEYLQNKCVKFYWITKQ